MILSTIQQIQTKDEQRNDSEQREIPQETLSASTGITLSSNQPTTFPNLEISNLPFHATTTRNLYYQNTFPHQHQPSIRLANSQGHTEATIYYYPDLIKKPPNTKT